MECIECQNCKMGHSMYYCAARDEFVIDSSRMAVVQKTRSGWKKGDPKYELHRRKNRKEPDNEY
ncbi:MAG: hypothetical protein GX041_03500 [Clostridiales bacterium]|jgi:hypothetical protein|nr:hypothetical protein [Clostridiales bacterium]